MSTKVHIDIPQKAIAGFCLRHHIRKLSLFGSVLSDAFRPDSDVDVLVEFEPGHVPGMIRFVQMEKELSLLLGGQKVDLVTAKFLNRRIRDQVLADAEVQYAKG